MHNGFTGGRPASDSLKEYARGIVGGLIFSFPMLYTMEVWWAGFIAGPFHFVALVPVTFFLLLGYNRYAGMRPGSSWRSIFVDSIEEMGIGLVLSFFLLFLLKRIEFQGMGLEEIMGKVVIEAMFASIGVSVGTAQLGSDSGNEEKENRKGMQAMLSLALCGAILVGGNVAPTEEIVMLAMEARPVEMLAMVLCSLLLSSVVVYFSDFRGSAREAPRDMAFFVTLDACLSYLVALLSSAFVLWFFGRFESVSFEVAFAQCVVLGFIASLGASAGRLLIK
ncbi:TIGR02587 family membrane protein [Pontibacter sp. SGAir0037]|uniref:TIGR02587 family membrane protein n=1 Tax=Pontibacter sp. SGAir0037 TaxID=2571030 RepID=UPI0010CD1659|nr:TIGR02587 family membrane protein [Pontibacter sp. SGAir0037]QCR22361.1 TIGR02587 family membrane protein [Pontibacter sp. SGAir0037]